MVNIPSLRDLLKFYTSRFVENYIQQIAAGKITICIVFVAMRSENAEGQKIPIARFAFVFVRYYGERP